MTGLLNLGLPAAAPIPEGATDSWFTPLDLWEPLHARHRFTLDVAGHHDSPVSRRIGRMFTIETNGLDRPWSEERVWCNPPYSDVTPWVEAAHQEMMNARGAELVVMLLPACRTEQPFWAEFIEPFRDSGRTTPRLKGLFALETWFIPRRRRFGFPGDPEGAKGHQPTFGLVLLTWSRL